MCKKSFEQIHWSYYPTVNEIYKGKHDTNDFFSLQAGLVRPIGHHQKKFPSKTELLILFYSQLEQSDMANEQVEEPCKSKVRTGEAAAVLVDDGFGSSITDLLISLSNATTSFIVGLS